MTVCLLAAQGKEERHGDLALCQSPLRREFGLTPPASGYAISFNKGLTLSPCRCRAATARRILRQRRHRLLGIWQQVAEDV